jgi:hypothetical protein
MGQRVRLPPLIILLVGMIPAGHATADPGPVQVRPEELAFRRTDHPATKSEGLFMAARFNGGHVLMLDLFHFDGPLVARWGIYVVVSDPAGKRQWITYEFDKSLVRTEPTRLWFSDGNSTVEGDGSSCRIALELPGFSCNLEVRNILPAWRSGDGVDDLTPDGRMFERRILACPWGDLTGRLATGAASEEVVGQALLDRYTRVTPLNRLHQSLYSVEAWSADSTPADDRVFLEILDITTNAAYGAKRLPRLCVAAGGRWLFTTRDYTFEPLDFDGSGPTPYPAPRKLRIVARASGYMLEAEYRATTLFDVTDIIAEVPALLRPIVRAFFSRPVYMRFLGVLEGTLTHPDGRVERISLTGPYEYLVAR